MSDVFLSYASEDRTRARAVAEGLEAAGWSVWWDRKIPAGKHFDEVIEEELGKCRCCVVLWSRSSVKSRWVKNEAGEGVERNILVPAMLEPDLALPLTFRRLHAADLTDWSGPPTPEFEALLEAVRNVLTVPTDRRDSSTHKPLTTASAETVPVSAANKLSMPTTCRQCGRPLLPEALYCAKCGASTQMTLDASVPVRLQAALGKSYKVMGELGSGGFAVVYLVRDIRLDRPLAVKVIQPYLLASRRAVERFEREAKFAAQLNHPNILTVTFAGDGGGLVYFAMPRVQGHTLRERIARNGPLTVSDALRIFSEIAQGLEHAHRRGIVHRDIKTGNIMLDSAGRALILDFGIAKGLADGESSLTGSGEIIGTAEYLSPEQASGSSELDARSDIYSLGIVAFEMLAGKPPFQGRSAGDLIRHHLQTPAPDIREQRPEVPEPFAAAINRCLEKSPAQRWGGAEMAARAAGADVPISLDATVPEVRRTPSRGGSPPSGAGSGS